jgi:hypothetical protein
MLHPPQELVRAAEIVEFFSAEVLFIVKLMQSEESSTGPQPRFRSSVNALQTLDKKLDIANPAAINFYVNTGPEVGSRRPTPS